MCATMPQCCIELFVTEIIFISVGQFSSQSYEKQIKYPGKINTSGYRRGHFFSFKPRDLTIIYVIFSNNVEIKYVIYCEVKYIYSCVVL